jgi:hypothetical protein
MAKEKFERPAADAPIMRTGKRSHRTKLMSLVNSHPDFESFKVNEKWTDAELESAIKNHMKTSQTQTVPRGGARIEAPENNET